MEHKSASFNNGLINTLAPLIGSSRSSALYQITQRACFARLLLMIRVLIGTKRTTGSNNRFKSEAARANVRCLFSCGHAGSGGFGRLVPQPDSCTAAKPHHSITSSARSRIAVGSSMPIVLAVFRFTTISNFVGCSIGKSAGWAPRAIRSTNSATRPKSAVMLGP